MGATTSENVTVVAIGIGRFGLFQRVFPHIKRQFPVLVERLVLEFAAHGRHALPLPFESPLLGFRGDVIQLSIVSFVTQDATGLRAEIQLLFILFIQPDIKPVRLGLLCDLPGGRCLGTFGGTAWRVAAGSKQGGNKQRGRQTNEHIEFLIAMNRLSGGAVRDGR